ncbi:MAG: hypothetical protein ACKO1J_00355 [Tagaea sp.]
MSEAQGIMPRASSPDAPAFLRAVAIVLTAMTDPNVTGQETTTDPAFILR